MCQITFYKLPVLCSGMFGESYVTENDILIPYTYIMHEHEIMSEHNIVERNR